MRRERPHTMCLVGMSLVGLLLPPSALSHATEPLRQCAARDLALDSSGVLRGQVVNGDAVGQAGAIVTINFKGRKEVARATTNRQGEFAVSGLKSGVYAISSGEATAVVRVWQIAAAPPAATQGILLVPDKTTLRGKGKGGAGGLSNVGLGTILAVGAVGTILAVAIAHGDAS